MLRSLPMFGIPHHPPAAAAPAPQQLVPPPAAPVPKVHSPSAAPWDAVFEHKTSQARQISGSAAAVVAPSPAIHRTWPGLTSACAPGSPDFALHLHANLSTAMDMDTGDMAPSPCAAGSDGDLAREMHISSDRRLRRTMDRTETGASRQRFEPELAGAGSSATSKHRRQKVPAGSKQSASSKPRVAKRPKGNHQTGRTHCLHSARVLRAPSRRR